MSIVETAPLGAYAQFQVARWIVGEAIARGFDARLAHADTAFAHRFDGTDVVLMMLHEAPSDRDPDDFAVPWEHWLPAVDALVANGASLILIASGARPGSIATYLRSGAHAVVDVDDAKRALDIVEDLIHGSLARDELSSVLPCPFPRDQLARLSELTANESRVLYFLTCGFTAERIAAAQWTSISTVRAHIRSIFRKLGVNSQIAAVAYANGTVSTDPPECDEGEL